MAPTEIPRQAPHVNQRQYLQKILENYDRIIIFQYFV